jgi:A/G-specific adenine glycosylase
MLISKKLQSWYLKNKRDLAWRATSDPYKIWLSEVILQQTQVIQGTAYYVKFIENYPTVKDLANASEAEVLKLWQGLGYYSRARNLHAAAKHIVKNHGAKFPNTYPEILNLKGVGPYTAAAIASIAFNEAKAVVDGNVYRVLSRLFNLETPIDSALGKKQFQALADEILDKKNPGNHNQAMMELGALCCKPSSPSCERCPINEHCLAFKNNTVAVLPVKSKKLTILERYLEYVVLEYKNHVYLQKRTNKDIWQNMYEFFLIEMDKKETEKMVVQQYCQALDITSKNFTIKSVSPFVKHILTHRHIFARFHHLVLKKEIKNAKSLNLVKYEIGAFEKLAFPRLIDKFVINNFN